MKPLLPLKSVINGATEGAIDHAVVDVGVDVDGYRLFKNHFRNLRKISSYHNVSVVHIGKSLSYVKIAIGGAVDGVEVDVGTDADGYRFFDGHFRNLRKILP